MRLLEDIEIHDTLNPKIWDLNSKKLLPEVKDKVVEIVSYFEKEINVPIEIVDVQICGSSASFNYHDKSDLDVHIIANFEAVSENTALMQTLYDAKKSEFNKKYDITIHGIEIEMYVQDINSTVVSNGIYSVCDDTWIKEPKPITSVKNPDTTEEVMAWNQHIDQALQSNDYDTILHLIDNLYLMRHNSIAVDGEFGVGNIIFKDLRNAGLVDKLKDGLNHALSDKLSLEHLDEGWIRGSIINRL